MFCMKCEVFLCCQGKRNCYTGFHTEDKGTLVHTPAYLVPPPDSETEGEIDNPDTDPQDTQSVPSNHDSDLE